MTKTGSPAAVTSPSQSNTADQECASGPGAAGDRGKLDARKRRGISDGGDPRGQGGPSRRLKCGVNRLLLSTAASTNLRRLKSLEVLEAVVTARRDKGAALKLLKRIMKKYGQPRSVVTDGLCSYSAALKELGNADRHDVGGRLNNRAENSHQPFRRRERAMQRFRSPKTLQKFSSVHAQVHNHFNQERHLVTRQIYKQRRTAALAEWRALAA